MNLVAYVIALILVCIVIISIVVDLFVTHSERDWGDDDDEN